MIKSLQLLAILFLAFNQQASAQCRRDTLKTFTVNSNNVKTIHSRIIFTYNSNDRVVSELYQPYINQVWVNNKNTTYSYNSSQQLLTKTIQFWNTDLSQWNNNKKEENLIENGNITEEIEWFWSTSINNWTENKRTSNTYNNAGKIVSKVNKNQTLNISKVIYDYDNNGNNILEEFLKWQDNSWVKNNKSEKTYDANNNVITNTPYFWNPNTLSYDNGERVSYLYNSNHQVTLETRATWDMQNNSYIDVVKVSFTYNSYGMTQKITENYYGPQVGFKPSARELRNYNQQNLLSEIIIQNYNAQTQVYDENYKSEFGYNSNGLQTIQTNLNWNGTQYVPQNRETWEYNSSNKLIKNTNWSFVQQFGFLPYQEKDYEYIDNDLLIAFELKTNFQSNVWFTRNREEYSCTRTTVFINKTNTDNLIKLYPNPANTNILIENLKENTEFNIYSQFGQVVKSVKSIETQLNIIIEDLNNGIYYLKCGDETIKFIKN